MPILKTSCWALGLSLALAAAAALAQDEVPFITTPDRVTLAMLTLAGVGPADHLIDLGSGDGRIVITAARRMGASGLGVEIVPELVQRSRAAAQAAGVADRVSFREQDLFETDLSRASVVTMYLLPEVNLQLRPHLLALAPGTRLVSHDWDMGDWRPDRSLTLDVPEKAVGRDKRSTVHLWVVPARVQGLWCGPGGQVQIDQRFQAFSAAFSAAGGPGGVAWPAAPTLVVDGLLDGTRLQAAGLLAQAEPGALQMTQLPGVAARWAGQRFVPAQAGRCPG